MPILGQPRPSTPPGGDGQSPRIELVGVDGSLLSLADDSQTVYLQPGPAGHGSPAYALQLQPTPARHGAVLLGVRAPEKQLFYPVIVKTANRAALIAAVRNLAKILDPTRGTVEIRVREADGTGRKIVAYYAGGMEGDEGRDLAGRWFQKFGLSFKAPDPFWSDLNAIGRRWTNLGSTNFFPLLPLNLQASAVLGSVTINNPGDADAYPQWTVTGPATALTLTNVTTGKTLTVTRTLTTTANKVIIDTRPGVLSIVNESGANVFAQAAAAPALWPLVPGDNAVTLTVTGASTGSAVDLAFVPRYQTA